MIDNHSNEEKCNCPNCNPRLQFNEVDVYNYQIRPLLDKAKEIAIRNGIPILMATCCGAYKDGGEVKIVIEAGGSGREGWAPNSFAVARRMIISEARGEFPNSGGIVAISGGAPGPMGGLGPVILASILSKIADSIPDGEEGGEDARQDA